MTKLRKYPDMHFLSYHNKTTHIFRNPFLTQRTWMHIRYIIDFVENDWRMVYKSNLL